MAKNEILILSSWYPTKDQPFLGNFVVRNAQLLQKTYNITIVNTIPSDSISALSLEESNSKGYREIQVTHPRGKNVYSKKRWQKKALKRAFLETNHFDLIIGHVLLPKALQFVVAKKNFNCPLILVEHGSYYRKGFRSKWNRLQNFVLKYTRKHFNEVIAVSSFLKNDIKKEFPNHEISVIGNHIDINAFNLKAPLTNATAEFIHISTLDPATKNPQGIIDACEALKLEEENFHLTVICDEDFSRWQSQVESKELNKHISFLGPLKWHDLAPYYQRANAFILNSTYESFSIVIAEAWATGTPVISTSVGIANELPPALGIQIEKNNPISLKNAMLTFIKDEDTYSSKLIRERAMQFSEKEILTLWTKTIEKHVK